MDSFFEAAKARYKKAVAQFLKEASKNLSDAPLTKKEIRALVVLEHNKNILQISEDLLLGSALLGMKHSDVKPVKKKSDFADGDFRVNTSGGIEPIPFEEAVQFLKARISMPKDEWLSLEQKLRFRAFTVARLAEADYMESIRGTLVRAVEKGEGVAQSWAEAKALFEADDVKVLPGYWETVYRTNTQSAYNAGRLIQYQNNPPPAWELLFIEDGRTSHTCRGLARVAAGKALLASHPFWKRYGFPPYHFNCRTTFRAVYDVQGEAPIENVTMKSLRKNFHVQKGFGGNPIEKESWWKITPGMIARADRYGITADIVSQAREFDMQSYFPELLQGYVPAYKGKKGGSVHKAKNWDYREEELMAAKKLADLGHRIYLLPRTDKAKSPDMLIDDEIGEIKHITSIKWGTIRDHIKKSGEKQRGRIVYIHIKNQKQKDRVLKIVKEEIENIPLKTLMLDFNGTLTKYGRRFFE